MFKLYIISVYKYMDCILFVVVGMNLTGMFVIVFAATLKTITLSLDGLYSRSVYKNPGTKILISRTDANDFKPYTHI